jgi:hypothetical protein
MSFIMEEQYTEAMTLFYLSVDCFDRDNNSNTHHSFDSAMISVPYIKTRVAIYFYLLRSSRSVDIDFVVGQPAI